MARLDLFALAQANGDAISKQFEEQRAAMAGDDAVRLDTFCERVKTQGGISINMKPRKLVTFLLHGRYLTVREIAAQLAAVSGRSAEEELRLMQGSYYERRVLFEESFEDGERFLYGALNIGGAGASEYGVFCVFLGDETFRAIRNAFVPDNSLDLYVRSALMLALDDGALRKEVAAPAQRHCLAALKHACDMASVEPVDWPTMLCCRERFVEAIFVGDVSPELITELRISRNEMRRLSDLAFDDMMGALAPSDRVELDEFKAAMEKLDDKGLTSRTREV